MGKFYKILKIICLIIFILSFFTRVFAFSDPMTFNISGVDYNVNVNYIISNYDYYYILYYSRTYDGYTYYNFFVYCSNEEFTATRTSTGLNISRTGTGTLDIYYISNARSDRHSWSDCFSRWNSYTMTSSNGNNYAYFSDGYMTIKQTIGTQSLGSYIPNASDFIFSSNSLLCNFDLKNSSGNVVFENNVEQTPYIVNSAQIPDWSFDSLELDLGSEVFDPFNDYLGVSYNNNDVSIHIYTKILESASENSNYYYISKQNLSNYIYFIEDSNITFTYQRYNTTTKEIEDLYDLGTYRVFLTNSVVNDLNNNSEQNFKNDMYNGMSNIDNSIQQGNQQNHEDIQELKDTMTDSTVESTASDLPSTNVNDISAEGINTIFQSIYNAFCTGNAQDIVFPIPFTGKNITLSPYYVRDMLNNNGATWVYTLIQAFWGYLIGRYIVKDVSKKITKIKGGNIENIENDNIKEEML